MNQYLTNESVELFRIKADDVRSIVPIHHALWHRNAEQKELPDHFVKTHDMAYFEYCWFSRIGAGDAWLAESNGELVGFFHVGPVQETAGPDGIVRRAPTFPRRPPEQWWELSNLYVRDTSKGVGSLLLSCAEEALKENAQDGVLWAVNPLVDLHNFYFHRGWTVIGFETQEPTEGESRSE